MKQYSSPVIVKDGVSYTLEKISLNHKAYSEDWIQNLCYTNPSLLPIEEIEPIFGGMIPICRELSLNSGFVDLVYCNEYGYITIGECKLWRNPEARRKVVGQVLDYAKDLAKLSYSEFENTCIKARGNDHQNLFEIVYNYYPDTEESVFIDAVQNNLRRGRFLLTVIGDGIRENMEELVAYIHRSGNLNFTMSLIEIPVYKDRDNGNLIITPRVLVKTKEIERVILSYW